MKVGILAPLRSPEATPELISELARGAESAGATSIWPGEHVVLFPQPPLGDEPARVGTPDGTLALPRGSGLIDLTVVLSYLAALTSRVRLGTGVRILPQANPVYVAKELASLDWVSGGRVDFGIGVGSNPAEFAACGAPYAHRGERNDEYVALIRTLWRDDPASFHGRFWSLPECSLDPKPRQLGGPPVIVGGHSRAALARVARLGDGWYAIGRSPEATRELLAVLDGLLAENGRDRRELRVVMGAVGDPARPSSLDPYEEAGVDEVLVVLGRQDRGGLARTLDAVHAFASRP
ncbi:MAG: TIGR03619 family F420-dependent LLM class oxidoreductase [Acidimicrobiia bacterium]|nr:TIGR03619 family F420-dependent LLM class oxidoreductase [Acidimicrobiia bacterium]